MELKLIDMTDQIRFNEVPVRVALRNGMTFDDWLSHLEKQIRASSFSVH